MLMNIRPEIHDFILGLVKEHQEIYEIWFYGSRANNANVKSDSDWDFLIYAKPSLYNALQHDDDVKERAKVLNIDLLVEREKNTFESPWYQKRLTQQDLKWQKISNNRVKYFAAKLEELHPSELPFLSEWEEYALERGEALFDDISSWQNGFRIWPMK